MTLPNGKLAGAGARFAAVIGILCLFGPRFAAAADKAAASSTYQYFWFSGPTANCFGGDGAAITPELAYIDSVSERCNSTFDSWIGSWPNSEGIGSWHHVCQAPDIPVTWGMQHEEQLNFMCREPPIARRDDGVIS